MATKIDKARRFANDFVFKHDLGLSEEGAELFAKSILAVEEAAEQSVQPTNLTPAQLARKRREIENVLLPAISG